MQQPVLIGQPLQVCDLANEPIGCHSQIGRRLGKARIGLITERRKERRNLIAAAQYLNILAPDPPIQFQRSTHSRHRVSSTTSLVEEHTEHERSRLCHTAPC